MHIASVITTIVALAGLHGEGPPVPDVYEGDAGQLTVATPVLTDARIRLDAVLDEAAWSHAAVLTRFTQHDPSEGLPASQPTEVLVFVTDEAMYFGIRAHEADPGAVRATLSERDEFTRSDDYVRLVLDTFDDQRRAYVFTVNPLGVQHDGLWIEGRVTRMGGMGPPIDDNQDFVWESNGRITDDGWVAEIRIPFKSLRFPESPLQDWGINVFRRFQKTGFEEAWAPITGNVANKLAQGGRLQGLRDLDPGLFLEVNPVLTGKRVGEFDADMGRFQRESAQADFGLNATYGITSNLTLDATYNPDFSQVEADAGQIAVNERFAFFFPEKRPFFLEGTEIFALPKNLIYTRSIVDPVGGAKLTGKVGSLNLGYLGAVDEGSDGGDAVVNLLRVRRDLGASSTVGALFTDRTRGRDDFNRVAGADARLVLARRYTLTALGAASLTERPGQDIGTGSFFNARFERAGRGLSYDAEIEDAHPDFRAASGFLRRMGETQLESSARFNLYGAPGALVERWGPSLTLRGFWDHDAFWAGEGFQEAQAELGGSVSLRNNVSIFLNWTRSSFDAPAVDYGGLEVAGADGGPGTPFRPDQGAFSGMDGVRAFVWVNAFERVRGNARIEWRETPIFDRSLGVPVEAADGWSGDVSLNLFPTRALQGEVGVRHATLNRKSDGSRYSSATIPRVRVQYQFTRSLFVRSILEYATQERAALVDPVSGRPLQSCGDGGCDPSDGAVDHDVHVEALVSFEPSPGTVMYLGYSREMVDPERFGFRDLEPRADGLFAKVSYRFRF